MRASMRNWVEATRQSFEVALRMADRGDLGVTVDRIDRPELPGPDAPPEAVLRALTRWKEGAPDRWAPGRVEAARADAAMVTVCRAIEVDDGSVAALARFARAAAYWWVLTCRAQAVEEARLIATLPHERPLRPGRPDAVTELLRLALRNARFGVERTGATPRPMANDRASLLDEGTEVLRAEADAEVGHRLWALLGAVDRDDGSPPAWQAVRHSFAGYLRVMADRSVVEAERVYATVHPGETLRAGG